MTVHACSIGFSALARAAELKYGLIETVHVEFLANSAVFDAGIVVWRNKQIHDAVRPFTAVRQVYGSREVTAWGGPGKGTVTGVAHPFLVLR